jgi:heptosyltransferase-2
LQEQPGIATVIPYDKRGTQRGLRGLLGMVRTVRSQGYHLILSPHRSLRSAVLVASSGSPHRIGFTQWWTRWAYTDTVPRPHVAHEVERHLHLLTALDAEAITVPRRLALQVNTAARQQAEQYFARLGVAAGDEVIGVIPGSQWGTKRWPAERFAALIEHLVARPQTHCVLFGAFQDRAIAEAITAACRGPVLDLIGHTTLQTLPAFMDRCTVMVSNDTGPMHIAAALGKPIVTLYGPTTAAMGFTPYGVPWQEVSVALDCRPCNTHGPHHCPLSHWRCMLDISVDQVVAGVLRLLQHTRAAAERMHSISPATLEGVEGGEGEAGTP